ncbi:MAG: fatty acid desaturase [Acidobacteria bacterium]|nr:fatty acid desaturase [Acidobacteriota bacterium]
MALTRQASRLGVNGYLFFLLHIASLGAFLFPFRMELAWWLVGTYILRMFGVTAGYHRYFSHHSYKLGRTMQFLMAFLAQTSGQKGILWWAAHHRWHHRHADDPQDIHSPSQSGFWWSHVGWIISNRYDNYDAGSVAAFARYPELRWLDRFHWAPPTAFGAGVFLLGGWAAFFWGFILSTVLLYHATFSINSLAHLWGTRRFQTTDQSRNNWLLAILTLGEGWHNNHHYYAGSCRQGCRWWELDITFYVLKLLSFVRIASELRPFRVAGLAGGHAA